MLTRFTRRLLMLLVLTATPCLITSAIAQNTTPGRANILFTQQDEVQEFVLHAPDAEHPAPWGTGYQTGTAIGKISGTSFVTWAFQVLEEPVDDTAPIAFDNTAIVTDLDGDQITFRHVGTGVFHFADHPDGFRGTGGTLKGTYEVTAGTGKYAPLVGNKYGYRGVATNPPQLTSAAQPALGTVYAEVYSNVLKK